MKTRITGISFEEIKIRKVKELQDAEVDVLEVKYNLVGDPPFKDLDEEDTEFIYGGSWVSTGMGFELSESSKKLLNLLLSSIKGDIESIYFVDEEKIDGELGEPTS